MNRLDKNRNLNDYEYRVHLIHLSFQEMAHPHKIVWIGNRCKIYFKCCLCGKTADKFVHSYKYFYMNCRYCIGIDTRKRNEHNQRILSKAYN